MIGLSAEHQHGWHTHVLAFCRYSKSEMALIAINFNDGAVDLFMNLKNLKYYFTNYVDSNIVVKLQDWSGNNNVVEEESYYYIGELINQRLYVRL
jgi:starch synthase